MSTFLRYACLLLVLASMFRCSPVYVPNARNVPLFKEGGEFKATASVGLAGANLQTAYAVSKHVAVMANGMYADNEGAGRSQYRTHQMAEAGIGYYHFEDNFTLEFFAGYGGGKGVAVDSGNWLGLVDEQREEMRGTYQRYFVQPAFGFHTRRAQFGFTARVSILDFKNLTYTIDTQPQSISSRTRVFIEPAFVFRISPTDHFFLTGQVGFAGLRYGRRDNIDYSGFQASFGVGIKLSKKKPAEN